VQQKKIVLWNDWFPKLGEKADCRPLGAVHFPIFSCNKTFGTQIRMIFNRQLEIVTISLCNVTSIFLIDLLSAGESGVVGHCKYLFSIDRCLLNCFMLSICSAFARQDVQQKSVIMIMSVKPVDWFWFRGVEIQRSHVISVTRAPTMSIIDYKTIYKQFQHNNFRNSSCDLQQKLDKLFLLFRI
jgi:hypothetical protein